MTDTCFVLPGPEAWASSRLRGIWPSLFMPDSVCVQFGQELPRAQNYVWIKAFSQGLIEESRKEGARNYLDFCDPVWWWRPLEVGHALDFVDGVVVTCEAMAEDFKAQYQTVPAIIKDRLYLPHFDLQHTHQSIQRGEPVRFIWFGASQNRHSLLGALAPLERLCANGVRIALTIVDDKPSDYWRISEYFPIAHVAWSLEREVEIIAAHDIAILPPYPGAWGRLKTNNKALHAWACGVAVSDGFDFGYLWNLATNAVFRAHAANAGRQLVETEYNVEQSTSEWQAVLNG